MKTYRSKSLDSSDGEVVLFLFPGMVGSSTSMFGEDSTSMIEDAEFLSPTCCVIVGADDRELDGSAGAVGVSVGSVSEIIWMLCDGGSSASISWTGWVWIGSVEISRVLQKNAPFPSHPWLHHRP